jgi:hypothetical protein
MDGSRKIAMAAVGGVVLAGILFTALASEYAEIRICNSSAYSTEHVVVATKDEGLETLDGWFRLGVGECATRDKRFWWVDPAFFVHTRIPRGEHATFRWINDIVDGQLLSDDDSANDARVTRYTGDDVARVGEFAVCAADAQWVGAATLLLSKNCAVGAHEARVMPAYTFDDPSQWYYVWEHPNLPLIPGDGAFEDALEKGLAAARQLRTSVTTQQFNEREWGNIAPFAAGGRLIDYNGPLALGVWMTDVPGTTIFGQPMPIQSGDVVLRVNGQAVLSEREFNQKLIDHGLSRTAGIEVPVEYAILRGDQLLSVKAPYFFNEQYRKAASDQTGIAFWFGIGDAITFGQTPWVACHGSNVLIGLGKGLSMAAELFASKLQGRAYDEANEAKVEYIDAAECTWQKKQARAFARQKADNVYINSQWFAILTPSAVRLVGNRMLAASAAGAAGRTAVNRALANGALEAAETALWSMGTAAPGTPLAQRLGEAARLAPLGAAGGVLGTAALRSGSRSGRVTP